MTTETQPQSLEDEIASVAAGMPATPAAGNEGAPPAAPAAAPTPEGVEISARKAGSIRKQQEDERRQAQMIEAGVTAALNRLGFGGTPSQPAPAAAAPSPTLPDYLSGIDPNARTEWAESLKLTQQVGANAEERAYARAIATMEARYGPQIKGLEETMNRNHTALRTGVANSFTAANANVQKAEGMEGWEEFLQSDDESGMQRSNAYQYWMTNDPARAAKVLNTYATNFLKANGTTTPTGFGHMATPAQATGGSGAVTEVKKTVSAGAIKKLISEELVKTSPNPGRLQQLRDIQDKHAKAGTLVA
jgi:hypothetical protein